MPAAEAMVPVSDRGFMYGDGLFETTRVVNGRPFRLAQHLERMVRGADYLKIPLPFTPKELQKFTAQLVEANAMPDAVLRVTLTRGAGERGYSPTAAGQPTMVMSLHPLPKLPEEGPLQWSMITSSYHIPASGAISSFKTTSKILNVFARIEASERGADEALLLNTNGEVAETAGGNIFWVYQNTICTVPTGRGVLPGITRAVVLEICQALGLETNKRVIKPQHLRNAEGIFITQSVLGIVPVVAFDGEHVVPSPLVDQIATAYNDVLQRE
ncbi:MAG TPA: aminotransferase class IV [Candidatus Acidoferrales bacterium]|nr:aminotransferase class IV [Candidatus Acidoferrales bacterium]